MNAWYVLYTQLLQAHSALAKYGWMETLPGQKTASVLCYLARIVRGQKLKLYVAACASWLLIQLPTARTMVVVAGCRKQEKINSFFVKMKEEVGHGSSGV